MKFCHEILDTKLSYGVNARSISTGLEMVPGRDRRADGQNYHS